MNWMIQFFFRLASLIFLVFLIACSQSKTTTTSQKTPQANPAINPPIHTLSFSLQTATNDSSPVSAILWLEEKLAFANTAQVGLVGIPTGNQPQNLLEVQSLAVGENPIHLTSNQTRTQIGWVSNESDIHAWKVNDPSGPSHIAIPDLPVTSIAINPDGDELAFSSLDGKIERRSLITGEQSFKGWSAPNWLSNLSYSPDGSQIGGIDLARFTVYFFSLDGTLLSSIEWGGSARSVLYGAYFSPDWKTLAWVSGSAVQLTDLAAKQNTYLINHDDAVTAAVWSPDGSLLATASADNMEGNPSPAFYIWDSITGEPIERYLLDSPAQSLSFSSDGSRLSVLDSNGNIRIYNIP